MKYDAKLIAFLFYFLGHIVLPGAMHIVRASDHLSVQIDVRDRVDSVKVEHLAIRMINGFCTVKAGKVLIILVHKL